MRPITSGLRGRLFVSIWSTAEQTGMPYRTTIRPKVTSTGFAMSAMAKNQTLTLMIFVRFGFTVFVCCRPKQAWLIDSPNLNERFNGSHDA